MGNWKENMLLGLDFLMLALLHGCVTLSKRLNLFEPQFSYL